MGWAMSRRCKCGCKAELPSAARCEDIIEKKGYASIECLAAHAKAKREVKEAKLVAENKAWSKSLPKNTRELNKRDLKWQEDHTQTAFNKMRVQQELIWFYSRNIEPYCISCLKTKMDFCCGHNRSRGSNSFLQFDESNTMLQCNQYCNSSLSANIDGTSTTIGYLAGLRHRFGEEEGQSIIDYCKTSPTVAKRTAGEFEELRKGYNQMFRKLKPLADTAKFLFELDS